MASDRSVLAEQLNHLYTIYNEKNECVRDIENYKNKRKTQLQKEMKRNLIVWEKVERPSPPGEMPQKPDKDKIINDEIMEWEKANNALEQKRNEIFRNKSFLESFAMLCNFKAIPIACFISFILSPLFGPVMYTAFVFLALCVTFRKGRDGTNLCLWVFGGLVIIVLTFLFNSTYVRIITIYVRIITIIGMAIAVFLFVLSKKHDCESIVKQIEDRESLMAAFSTKSIEYDPVEKGERIYEEKLKSYQKELATYSRKKQRYDDDMATYDERLARAKEAERIGKKRNEEIEQDFQTRLQKIETGDDEYIKDRSLRIAEIKDEIDKMDLLSERYMDSIPEIITILNDYRADSIKEAINVLEQDRHAARMEAAQLKHNKALQSQNEEKNRLIVEENKKHNLKMEVMRIKEMHEIERHNREAEAMRRDEMEEIARHNTAIEDEARHQAELSNKLAEKSANMIAMCAGCPDAYRCGHKGRLTTHCSLARR